MAVKKEMLEGPYVHSNFSIFQKYMSDVYKYKNYGKENFASKKLKDLENIRDSLKSATDNWMAGTGYRTPAQLMEDLNGPMANFRAIARDIIRDRDFVNSIVSQIKIIIPKSSLDVLMINKELFSDDMLLDDVMGIIMTKLESNNFKQENLKNQRKFVSSLFKLSKKDEEKLLEPFKRKVSSISRNSQTYKRIKDFILEQAEVDVPDFLKVFLPSFKKVFLEKCKELNYIKGEQSKEIENFLKAFEVNITKQMGSKKVTTKNLVYGVFGEYVIAASYAGSSLEITVQGDEPTKDTLNTITPK